MWSFYCATVFLIYFQIVKTIEHVGICLSGMELLVEVLVIYKSVECEGT